MTADSQDWVSALKPQILLGSFDVGAGPAANSSIFKVPAGTHAIGLLVEAAGLNTLLVRGQTSLVNYLALVPTTTLLKGYFISPVLSALDSEVQVSASTGAGQGPTRVWVVAILDPEAVFVFDNLTEPAAVNLADPSGTAITVIGQPGPGFVTQQGLFALTASRRASGSYLAAAAFVAAAAATDVFVISSPATAQVRIRRITVGGIQTTGSNAYITIVKRSTRDTAGTFVADTAVPADSGMPAASAVVGHYTANPVLGALVGVLANRRIYLPANANPGYGTEFRFGDQEELSPLALNTTGEQVAVNLSAGTYAGNGLTVEAEWTEE